MYDSTRNLCLSNFNGRRMKKLKRLFPKIVANYDGFPSCAKCGTVEVVRGLQNGLCLECRKGEVCTSPVISHTAFSSKTDTSSSGVTSCVKDKPTGGILGTDSKKSPSSPPESDSPESAGWKQHSSHSHVYYKDEFELRRSGPDRWWGSKIGSSVALHPDGTWRGMVYDFHRWQDINAILFPEKREFRVGDLVECLPDGDAESSKLRAESCIGQQLRIITFNSWKSYNGCTALTDVKAACFDHGNWWPLRSLKLIEAAK